MGGGPLLDSDGNVVGVNTLKLVARGYEGLNFAISAVDLARVLQTQFGFAPPKALPSSPKDHRHPPSQGARLSVVSEPTGADIEIDGKFRGSTPSRLDVHPGIHRVVVKHSSCQLWERELDIAAGEEITVDYGETHHGGRLPCRCGATGCRGAL